MKIKRLTPETIQPAVRICNWHEIRPGASWGPRAINDFELIMIVSGRYSYQRPGHSQLVLESGKVLCIRPTEEHVFARIDTDPCSIISCIHLEFDDRSSWLEQGYELEPFPLRLTRPGNPDSVAEMFRRCTEVFESFGPYRKARLVCAVKSLVLELAAEWTEQDGTVLSVRMTRMLEYLRRNLLDGVTRRDLAAEFGITPEHVNALFKRELSITPTEFVNRERILMGYQLLRDEGMSVKEAAAATGFCDQFYFSKLFRRYMGVTPARVAWRV